MPINPRRSIILASVLYPGLKAHGEIPAQQYDYSFQLYQEEDDRIRVESHYIRGQIELNDATSFRFQWLNDAISGASPTGALPGSIQPFLSDVEDTRTGILGALSRQFGDHRVELEVSHSKEDDYLSRGYALSDNVELNQKNTTISYGFNYVDDDVTVPYLVTERRKQTYDLFTGVSQVFDKDTVCSVNFTLGYSEGYLNDPYKVVQRDELITLPFPPYELRGVSIYPENRPDSRLRQVLQFEGKHYFEKADGVLDGVLRLGHDDYGVFSQTIQLEWRQSAGEHFMAVPFLRYYHQNAADFFVNTLNDVMPTGTPSGDPDGSGTNYSADYRLSSFDAISGGLRLLYQINDRFSASAAYERYVMSGRGSASERSPDASYPSADIWTFGVSAKF